MIDLSIIIVNYNTKDYLEKCLLNLSEVTKGIQTEIFVVDNASTDGSPEMVGQKFPKVQLIKSSKNIGFGAGNNLALKKAKGRYLLLLNADIEIPDDKLLPGMIDWMDKNPKVGVSTCALTNPDKTIQATGGYFPTLGRVFAWMFFLDDVFCLNRLISSYHPKGWFYTTEKQVDWITGAFYLARAKVMSEVNYFDEDYFMYVEEVDLSYRLHKLGWEIRYLPQFKVIHYGQVSSSSEFAIIQEFKGLELFFEKHYPGWQLPMLKLLLKAGALLRVSVLGLLKGGKTAKTYVKAFKVV